ncbi:histidine phosphatase family protein [Sphaerisporangium flaviroseum]|uniref:Histidine phosphatase family protein n=1 Tax=Sphaerisporangium flaviroseum TaxID=509199 RepID=A0ABP7I5B6_9ACTN
MSEGKGGGRRVVFWRHGQTRWNLEQRFQGHTDIPLDETGLAQASRAASLLASLSPSLIVSSHLRRAHDTAATLAGIVGLDVAVDKDLRERGGGEWEGLTRAEIAAGWPVQYAEWEAPGGESVTDVADRVAAATRRWVDRLEDGGLMVIASHGAAIRLGVARILGLPEELWPALGGLGNCSWSVIQEGRRGWRLLEHNAGTLPEPVNSDDRPESASAAT